MIKSCDLAPEVVAIWSRNCSHLFKESHEFSQVAGVHCTLLYIEHFGQYDTNKYVHTMDIYKRREKNI